MKITERLSLFCFACLLAITLQAGCTDTTNTNNANTTANTNASSPPASPSPAAANLTETQEPQRIRDMRGARGEQDAASPALTIREPRENATITNSTVNVRLDLGGDLKGYKPMKDPSTGMGNHIHVILDNEPYEAYYELGQPFELRNVTAGKHTLRVFASRPWHESYKNDGSFQMVTFTVQGGGNPNQPTTTGSGQVMSSNRNANNANASANMNTNANANASPTREGKDMPSSTAGDVDRSRPLLTYSRPKGEYAGAEADPIMIDFWLTNAKLTGDGGQYRVRYSIDGGSPRFIDRWQPLWLTGWTGGKHSVKLELVDANGNVVDNGGYNSTTREITVVK
ncbi:MAG: hypothetical protein WKF74_01070 [Pyrinomonadaceae bacterium]